MGIVSAVLFSIFYSIYNKQGIIDRNLSSIGNVSTYIASGINNSLVDISDIAITLSTSELLEETLIKSNESLKSLEENELNEKLESLNSKWMESSEDNPFIQSYLSNETSQFLKKQQEALPGFYGEIFLTNKYGEVVGTTSKLTTFIHAHKYWWLAAYNDGKGKIFFDDRGFDPSAKGYVLGVVVPIYDENEIIGILKCNVNIESLLSQTLKNFSSQWTSERKQILRTEGLIVYEEDIEPLSESADYRVISLLENRESTSTILNTENGRSLISVTPIDITCCCDVYGFGGSYGSVDHTKGNKGEIWSSVVSVEESEVLADFYNNIKIIIFGSLIFVIATGLIAFIISSFITKHVSDFVKATEEFGRGNFNVKVDIKSKDEIGILARAFNKNVEQIKNTTASKAELEKEIKEKQITENKLSAANKRFEKFMDYFPGPSFIKDSKSRYVYFNKFFEKNIGNKDWFGKDPRDILDKTIIERVLTDDKKALNIGFIDEIEKIKFKDGKLHDQHTYKFRIDRGNEEPYLGGFSIDISERMKSIKEKDIAYDKIKNNFQTFLNTLSKIVEFRDPYTSGHQERVAKLSALIAEKMELNEIQIDAINTASLLHDIGKIYVPTEILNKAGKLSDLEFDMIKEHSKNGYDLLKEIDFDLPVAEFVLQHHERNNGSGYPNKLKENEIYIESKIIAVADVVEAISSHRPYRPALGIDEAFKEIKQNAGTLYDKDVVKACLEVFEEGFKF